MRHALCLLLAAASLGACSFHARGPDEYRMAVREVLDARQPDVHACYERAYTADERMKGRVVAKFQVAAKSGQLMSPQIVDEETTAPEPLKQCVLASLDGVTIAPPDQRTGDAKFVWDFGP